MTKAQRDIRRKLRILIYPKRLVISLRLAGTSEYPARDFIRAINLAASPQALKYG